MTGRVAQGVGHSFRVHRCSPASFVRYGVGTLVDAMPLTAFKALRPPQRESSFLSFKTCYIVTMGIWDVSKLFSSGGGFETSSGGK